VFVIGIGQPEGATVRLPIVNRGVANQVTRRSGASIRSFTSIDAFARPVVLEFGQDGA